MQTIINWTRYDGTEATLPMTLKEFQRAYDEDDFSVLYRPFLLCKRGHVCSGEAYIRLWVKRFPEWLFDDGPSVPFEVGDIFASYPTAPQE